MRTAVDYIKTRAAAVAVAESDEGRQRARTRKIKRNVIINKIKEEMSF